MDLLLDNDVICKICAYGLGAELISTYSSSTIHVLPTAKYVFGTAKPKNKQVKYEQKYGKETCDNISHFLSQVQEVSWVDATTPAVVDMSMIYNLDEGEAVLFAAAADRAPKSFVVTGDKRSIRVLATDDRCATIRRALDRKIICFEQAMLDLIDVFGFTHIRTKVASVIPGDPAVQKAFANGQNTDEMIATSIFKSYVNKLRQASKNLLRM